MKNYVRIGTGGRITIPVGMRRLLKWNYTDTLLLEVTPGNEIILKPVKEICAFCGRAETPNRKLSVIKDKTVCTWCAKSLMKDLKQIVEEEQ